MYQLSTFLSFTIYSFIYVRLRVSVCVSVFIYVGVRGYKWYVDGRVCVYGYIYADRKDDRLKKCRVLVRVKLLHFRF